MRVLHSALYQREEIKVSRGSVVQHSHPASVIRMRMRSCLVLLSGLVSLCGSQDTSTKQTKLSELDQGLLWKFADIQLTSGEVSNIHYGHFSLLKQLISSLMEYYPSSDLAVSGLLR